MRIRGIGSVGVMAVALVLGMPARAQGISVPVALSGDEVAWHLRAGLNVAALACRDANGAEISAGYNALLGSARVPLAAAAAGTDARYRQRYGAQWQARNDSDMTKLYNFFATPAAHARFCATAQVLLQQAARVEPGDFQAFANAALPQLEQAFVQVDDAPPTYAIATNARVPLAPVPREVAMRVADEGAAGEPAIEAPSSEEPMPMRGPAPDDGR